MADSESRSILVQAWIESRMERDRALLTLSGGGVGLIAGVVAALEQPSAQVLILFGAGAAAFMISVFSILQIFKRNSDYVERLLKDTAAERDKVLARLDWIASTGFVLGALLTSAAALVHQLI